jgi:hypothetical protein
MSSVEARIKACVEQLFRELDLLLQQRTLESLRALLEGAAVPARRARPRVRVAPAGGGSAEDLRDRIRARIRSSPGETVEEIARAVRGSPTAVKRVIQVLLAAKQIQRTGQGHGARYYEGARQRPRATPSRSSRSPRKPRRRRTRKARRSMRSPRKTRKSTKPRKQRRAHRPKRRAATRSPGKVIVPRRRRRPPAPRPAEALPMVEPVEPAQLEFVE